MTVVIWEENWLNRKASQRADSITATRQFLVVTNDKTDNEYDILTDGNAPRIGNTYPENPFLRVETITATQVPESWFKWIVVVDYSTRVPEDSDEIIPDPVRRPPAVTIGGIKSTEPLKVIPDYFNRNGGKPIVPRNSAGVPYDPPIEVPILDFAIKIVQNFANFHPKDITGFIGAVNSKVWETFEEGRCRIDNIEYVRRTQDGKTFWERSIEIHVRPITADYSWDTIYPWQVLVENSGVQQMDTENKEVEPIPYAGLPGVYVREYVGLDLLGRAQIKSKQPTFERWDVHDKKDFAKLDIRLT